jgi:DNA relaxase NicK
MKQARSTFYAVHATLGKSDIHVGNIKFNAQHED